MGWIALHTVKHDKKEYTEGRKVPVTGEAAKRLEALSAIADEKSPEGINAKANAIESEAEAAARAKLEAKEAAAQAAEHERRSKLTPDELAKEDADRAANAQS